MGSRDIATENKSKSSDFCGQAVATRDAYGSALLELGGRNEKVVVLDADLSGSTKTAKFAKAFPDRFFNMGIAEQDMISTAGGLSLTGKIPFASTFAVFETGRAWDQIRQTICYSELNVKLVATHAGITVGEDGASHQALEDIALMRVIPNMTVIVPSDGFETKQVIDTIADYNHPVYVRLGRSKVPPVMPADYRFGNWQGIYIQHRQGRHDYINRHHGVKSPPGQRITAEKGAGCRRYQYVYHKASRYGYYSGSCQIHQIDNYSRRAFC